MNSFGVFYLLSILYVSGGSLHNEVGISNTLDECQQGAARILAAQPQGTVKWACHEMTVKADEKGILVTLPEY